MVKTKDNAIDIRGLARFITRVESREPAALSQLAEFRVSPRRILGVTGPPGAGKSTLVNGLISLLRKDGWKVGVVAIDPSSPFSGGALLGDRVRMQDHAGDAGVFIRSVGSRGSHGGLSRATRDIVRSMEAYRLDYVIIETVGVGQTELDIMEIADVTVVVLVPESGDMIQTMKAGLLEIADIFVVNKADRPGAEQMRNWLSGMFDSGVGFDAEAAAHHGLQNSAVLSAGELPIFSAQANRGIGVAEILKVVLNRFEAVKSDPARAKKREDAARREFLELCADEIVRRLEPALGTLANDVAKGKISRYDAVKKIDKLVKFEK